MVEDDDRYSRNSSTADRVNTVGKDDSNEAQSYEAAHNEVNEAPPQPPTAKQRLAADGVKFIDEHLEPMDIEDDKRMTYYIVTLTWDAHPIYYDWIEVPYRSQSRADEGS